MKKIPGKKRNLSFALIIICFSFGFSFCTKEQPPSEEDLSENQILISGSAAVMPILRTLAAEFEKQQTDIKVSFPPDSHSAAGIAGAAEEHYDVGAISREMFPDEKNISLRYLHLAIDGLVFATSPNLNVTNLSAEQIRHIYGGMITNWAQVGGPNEKITVIDRPEYSSAKIIFRELFLGENLKIAPEAVTIERPWQVADSIRVIPYSIGYTSLSEVIKENGAINVISINNVYPTPSNLKAGKYKFFRPFGLVLGPNPKISTMRFLNFVFSDTGSKIIEKSGFIPQQYEILVGIVPEQNVMVQSQRYRPLVDYLSSKLGEKFAVNLKLFPTYMDVCKGLVSGEINAAFLGSLAYATVRRHVTVIARPDYGGISTYKGLIFTRADSGIDNLSQMRGTRLVMGGKTTTAGYVFPLYYFRKSGIADYRAYFSESNFVGTHEDAILAVLRNQADVGAAKDLIYRMLVTENPSLEEKLKILAESPAVPSNAFVLRKNLAHPCFECHQRAVQGAPKGDGAPFAINIEGAIGEHLITMAQDPKGREALAALGNATGFLKTTESDYAELYTMLKEINLNPEELLNLE